LTVGIYFQEIIRESGLSFLNYKNIHMEVKIKYQLKIICVLSRYSKQIHDIYERKQRLPWKYK